MALAAQDDAKIRELQQLMPGTGLRHWVRGVAGGLLLALWSMLAWDSYDGYRQTLAETESRARQMALSLQTNVDSVMGSVGSLLNGAEQDVAHLSQAPAGALNLALRTRIEGRPFVESLVAVDRLGSVLGHAPMGLPPLRPLSDASNFLAHANGFPGRLFVGDPVPGLVAGSSVVPVSRGLAEPGNAFGGMVMATLRPSHFQHEFQNYELGGNDILGLMRSDGMPLVRRPAPGDGRLSGQGEAQRLSAVIGRSADGVARLTLPQDGRKRLLAWRTVTGLPLTVFAALDLDDALAHWTQRMLLAGLLGLGLTTGVVTMTHLLIKQLHRREQVESSLFARKLMYRTILETTSEGFWQLDAQGRIRQTNSALCAMLGLSEGDLLGASPAEFCDSANAAILQAHFSTLRGAGMTEITLLRRDGLPVWVHVHSTRLPGEASADGGGLFSFVYDVTEARAHAERLRASEEKLRLVIEASHDGIWEWQIGAQRLICSERLAEMLALPRGVQQTSFAAFTDLVHPEDRATLLAALGDQTDLGLPVRREIRIRRGEAGYGWFAINGSARRDDYGRPVSMVGSLTDITERKRSEEDLRKLWRAVEQTGSAIFITDSQGRIEYVNRRFTQLNGYSLADVRGNSPRLLKSGETPAELYQSLWATITAGREWSGDLKNRRRDGTTYWAHLSISPIKGEDGSIANFVAIADDVTAQREQEHASKMEALGHLTGGVAHDFNNLLTIMLGNLEIMEELAADDPAMLDLVGVVRRMARRGASLTDRLLTMFRKQPSVSEQVDLNALVASLPELLERTLGPDIHVRLETRPDLPPVEADASRLENAVLNLALNARDAMPGGGSLLIETLHLTGGGAAGLPGTGDYAAVRVTDTGSGMSPQVRDQALTPFFTTKPPGHGTGLGLSTVQRFAAQYGGDVMIDSQEGVGTSVTLYFPVTANAFASEPLGQDDAQPAQGGGRVLVVDDEEEVRAVAVRLLSALGYQTVQAVDGPEALAILDEDPAFDLVFTDVVMPGGLSGRDLARRLGETHPGLPVLLTSGHMEDADGEGSGLLRKPYDRQTLGRAVQAALAVSVRPRTAPRSRATPARTARNRHPAPS